MLHLVLFLLFTNPCFSVDPLLNQFSSNEDLAKYYFEAGFSYKEIIRFLLIFHGLPISVRHLHRFLRKKGLSEGTVLQALIQLFLLFERFWKGQARILDTAQSIKN